jgi:hypothetical protein
MLRDHLPSARDRAEDLRGRGVGEGGGIGEGDGVVFHRFPGLELVLEVVFLLEVAEGDEPGGVYPDRVEAAWEFLPRLKALASPLSKPPEHFFPFIS